MYFKIQEGQLGRVDKSVDLSVGPLGLLSHCDFDVWFLLYLLKEWVFFNIHGPEKLGSSWCYSTTQAETVNELHPKIFSILPGLMCWKNCADSIFLM